LHWANSEQVKADLQWFVAEEQRKYDEIIAVLMRNQLLSAADRDRCPRTLHFQLIDRCELFDAAPLPAVPGE
jgi:hypothetical protein